MNGAKGMRMKGIRSIRGKEETGEDHNDEGGKERIRKQRGQGA